MRRWIIALAYAVVPTLAPPPADAWSTKEHVQLTRMAVSELLADPATPDDMKVWLKAAAPGLLDAGGERDYLLNARMGIVPHGVDGLMFWSVMPDLQGMLDRPNKKLPPPLNVHERVAHYFELEYYAPAAPTPAAAAAAATGKAGDGDDELVGDANSPAPAVKGTPIARPDPSRRPAASDIRRDPADPRVALGGALPYRVANCYDELVKAIRDGRMADAPGQFPRDEHAVRWAGYVAHYVQDSTQPHHATRDYKSRSFFPPGAKAPDVHAVMEYRPVDDEFNDYRALREAYWPLLQAALRDATELADAADPWAATVQASAISYDALPLIGAAAIASWDRAGKPESPQDEGRIDVEKFYAHRGTVYGREMSVLELKARQQAWAVRRTQAIWVQAWKEAKGG